MTMRVAGYGSTRQEIHGTTDTLLAGLERAVDPDGNGAVDDAVRVALVGVNAPYAAFADSAEAQAVRGAGKLGTLVVAPGRQRGPGAAAERRRRLARRGPHRARGRARPRPAPACPRVDVTVGGRELAGAAVLAGAPPPGGEQLAGPVTSTDAGRAAARRRAGRPRRAGPRRGEPGRPRPPPRRAPAPAPSCSPTPATARSRCCPPAAPPRPSSGLTGEAAKAALEAKAGAKVAFGSVDRGGRERRAGGRGRRRGGRRRGGPRAVLLARPRLRRLAEARHPRRGRGGHERRPRHRHRRRRRARRRPRLPALAPAARGDARRAARGARPAAVRRGRRRARRRRCRSARSSSPAASDEVVGVRFALGAFDRGDPLPAARRIEPASRLVLELVDARRRASSRRSRRPTAPATCCPPSTPTASPTAR